jgi:HPt (histidine-containing phosphotransfer) domain-containing protein
MTSASRPPLLDPAGIARLRQWGGESLVARMIDLFVEQGTLRLGQIRSGMADGDLDRVGQAAHSLKSSAGNLGAERLRALAGDLEERAGRGDGAEAAVLAAELTRGYDETVAELDRIRDGSDGGDG